MEQLKLNRSLNLLYRKNRNLAMTSRLRHNQALHLQSIDYLLGIYFTLQILTSFVLLWERHGSGVSTSKPATLQSLGSLRETALLMKYLYELNY